MKGILQYIFYLLSVFMLNSCSNAQNVNIIDFEYVKDIKLPISDSSKNIIKDISFQQTDSIDILRLALNDGYISNYDFFSEKLISTIPIDDKKLFSFHYHNSDSIFLFMNAAYNNKYLHDSILYRINNKGKVLNYYSFKQTLAPCSYKKAIKPDSIYYSYLHFQNLKFNQNKVFLLFGKYHFSFIGDNNFSKYNMSLGGHIDIDTRKYYQHIGIKHPYLKEGLFYPNDYSTMYVELSEKNNPIYAFSHTSTVLEYDLKTQKVIHHKMNCILADTISPALEPIRSKKEFNQAIFRYLYYNKVQNQYVRFIEQPEGKVGKYFYSIMLFDNNFEIIAEGIFPKHLSASKLFFKGENVIAYNSKKTANNKGNIVFSVYKMNLKKSSKKNLLNKLKSFEIKKNKIKNNNYLNFLKNIHKFDTTNFIVVTIPFSKSCPSCVKRTLDFFSINKKALQNKSVFLLISGENKNIILPQLKEANLLPDETIVFYDDNDSYLPYHKFDIYNPRLTIVKNNEIIHDKVYNPDEIIILQKKISIFIK